MPRVFILCGGLGTRITSLGFGLPKPLIKFPRNSNKSILEQILIRLRLAGCEHITLIVNTSNYSFFADQKHNIECSTGLIVDFLLDPPALSGTAAWLLEIAPNFDEDIVVLNGDTYLDGDIYSFINHSLSSIVGTFSSARDDAGNIAVDSSGKVIQFSEKSSLSKAFNSPSLNYSGILKIQKEQIPSLLLYLTQLNTSTLSLEHDVLPFLAKTNKLYIFNFPIEAFDIGTPERFEQLSKSFPLGFQNKIAFWDRDSTLNIDYGYTHKLEDLVILEDKIPFLSALSRNGYSHIVVTNQSGIGRKFYSEGEMHRFNNELALRFLAHNIYFTDFLFCPHLPDDQGNPTCICRKPQSTMYVNALAKYNGSAKYSLIVGDKISDIAPAEEIGCTAVLHPPGAMVKFKSVIFPDV